MQEQQKFCGGNFKNGNSKQVKIMTSCTANVIKTNSDEIIWN